MKLQIDNLVYKYKEDCNDASSLFTNTELTKNLVNDLTSLFYLNGVVVPKGTFNCGQERAFGEERCKVQCKDCVIEYQDN